jgi:hypothetical protein
MLDGGGAPADPAALGTSVERMVAAAATGMDLDAGEAPADPAALGTSVERMVAAAATGNATGPMMAQEIDLLSFIHLMVLGQPGGSSGGRGEMICSRSASSHSAGSSGSGHSGGSACSVSFWTGPTEQVRNIYVRFRPGFN